MKKTDNYGARVKIENIVEGDPSEVDENSLFALLTGLTIKKGRIFDMDIILASRDDKYSGHSMLAEKRLPADPHPCYRHLSFRVVKLSCEAGGISAGVFCRGSKRRIQKRIPIFLQIMRNIS